MKKEEVVDKDEEEEAGEGKKLDLMIFITRKLNIVCVSSIHNF